MHLRTLPARIEYLYGVLPTVPFFDDLSAKKISDFISRENSRGNISAKDKANSLEVLYSYLFGQYQFLREQQPLAPSQSGASLVLRQIDNTLQHYWHGEAGPEPGSELDIV